MLTPAIHNVCVCVWVCTMQGALCGKPRWPRKQLKQTNEHVLRIIIYGRRRVFAIHALLNRFKTECRKNNERNKTKSTSPYRSDRLEIYIYILYISTNAATGTPTHSHINSHTCTYHIVPIRMGTPSINKFSTIALLISIPFSCHIKRVSFASLWVICVRAAWVHSIVGHLLLQQPY